MAAGSGLADIGGYYRDYVRLMAHIDAVQPGRVHLAHRQFGRHNLHAADAGQPEPQQRGVVVDAALDPAWSTRREMSR